LKKLDIDFETFSELPLAGPKSVGPWAYSCHPSTGVFMMAWAFDDDEPKIWLYGEPLPFWVHQLNTPEQDFVIYAQNDFFEVCIMRNTLKWNTPPPELWYDIAAQSAALALPRKLEDVGDALKLDTKKLKDPYGKKLIQLFCSPRKSQKKINKGELIWKTPEEYPVEFQKFRGYCIQDVVSQRATRKSTRPLSESERRVQILDRKINLRGVGIDMDSVEDAIVMIAEARKQIEAQVADITAGKLDNVGSTKQFKEYSHSRGFPLLNTQKEYLKTLLDLPDATPQYVEKWLPYCEQYQKYENDKAAQDRADTKEGKEKAKKVDPKQPETIDPTLKKIIGLRLSYAKSSLAKYDKLKAITVDGRAYGLLRYHGASTGRWSGNLFPPQNLPRPSFDVSDECISLFHHRNTELISMIYGDVLEAMSSCLRGMIKAAPGKRLVVSDFSQIESRVLAWLVGDHKKLKAFADGLDIYKVNAATIYKKDYEDVTKDERQTGKVAELACGYQGAKGAFMSMADTIGVHVEESHAEETVKAWRLGNPKITSYWHSVQDAAIAAVDKPGTVHKVNTVAFKVVGDFLHCRLPSGRMLAYHRPYIKEGKFGYQVGFYGVDSVTSKYGRQTTYGGKLVENITQAVARDFMVEAMLRLEKAGYPIILTVHDEVVAEVERGFGSLEEFNNIMEQLPEWASNIPIDVDGYESERYRK